MYKNLFLFSVYDPDPLMSTLSRRKRLQSWESGTSDGSRAAKTPRASIDEMSPPTPKNNHVHSGDLKMRIHVGASPTNSNKQRKSSGNNPGQSSGGSNISYATSKNVRKASLAQRPSISSVRTSNGNAMHSRAVAINFNFITEL